MTDGHQPDPGSNDPEPRFVYFIRHAQTQANKENLLIGRNGEHGLNTVGLRQAVCLAERLRAEDVRVFWSSPLLRAVQTARILNGGQGTPSLSIDQDLTERDYGRFDGMDRPSLLTARAELGLDNRDPTGYFPVSLADVEPLLYVQKRMARAWLSALEAAGQYRKVGLVSHAGTIKALLYGALGIDEDQPRAFKVFQASYVKCKIAAAGHLTVHEIWINPVQR